VPLCVDGIPLLGSLVSDAATIGIVLFAGALLSKS